MALLAPGETTEVPVITEHPEPLANLDLLDILVPLVTLENQEQSVQPDHPVILAKLD